MHHTAGGIRDRIKKSKTKQSKKPAKSNKNHLQNTKKKKEPKPNPKNKTRNKPPKQNRIKISPKTKKHPHLQNLHFDIKREPEPRL